MILLDVAEGETINPTYVARIYLRDADAQTARKGAVYVCLELVSGTEVRVGRYEWAVGARGDMDRARADAEAHRETLVRTVEEATSSSVGL